MTTASIGRRLAIAAIVAVTCASHPLGQPAEDRFWIAGRYDRDHVIIYFVAGKFGDPGILPGSPGVPGTPISRPLAKGFFEPRALSAAEMAGFAKNPDAEPFAIGDRFEMLLGGGRTIMVTLTTNVGFLSDEGSGNDSYIGALARVEPSAPGFTGLYYVVRRGNARTSRPMLSKAARAGPATGLRRQPVSAAITRQVVNLIPSYVRQLEPPAHLAEGRLNDIVDRAQQFTTADGLTRYYVAVRLRRARDRCWLTAIAAANPVRILATEERYCLNNAEAPRLLTIVDLGNAITGIIADTSTGASADLRLLRYTDGTGLGAMPVLHQIVYGD